MATVVDLLRRRAQTRTTDTAFRFLADGDPATAPVTTYGELDRAARAVAATLVDRQVSGQPVLVACPPGPTFVAGFLGCLYAGAVAVPVHPPELAGSSRSLPRLQAVLADSGARVAIGPADVALACGTAPQLAGLQWVDAESLPASADDDWQPASPDGDALALLQYTSGSTGAPKGVMISHANLMHNAKLVQTGFGTSPQTVGVSWLPPYHDMGLIGGILQPIYAGFPVVLMPPAAFLRRPLTWLETISRFRATMSGGPNFAFDLCVRRTTAAERATLDLSTWTLAFNGAEPVRAATLDRFAEAFAPAGFRREAFYPCYGLAEATLIVSGGQPPRHAATGQVSTGRLDEQRLAIANPANGTACPDGSEGEIWLAGPSVARGYWGQPDETARTFHAALAGDPHRRYLRTGDLGYLDATGDLVVTGRSKDLIIVRGRNLHPEDLEQAVEQRVPGLRPGGCVAVGLERAGEERVAVACEVQPPLPDRSAAGGLLAAVQQALAEEHQVAAATVVLLRPGRLPRTTSGKVRRQASRQALHRGDWDAGTSPVLARWDEPLRDLGRSSPSTGPHSTKIAGAGAGAAAGEGVAGLVGDLLGLPPATLPADTPLTRLGMDSLRAIELQGLLADRYGAEVPASQLLSGTTPAQLADLVDNAPAGAPGGAPADAPPAPGRGDGPCWEQVGQRALWLLQRWDPASTAYQINRAARIRTRLDTAALDRAFTAVVAGHPVLRTRLPARDGQPDPVPGPVPALVRYEVAGQSEQQLRQRVQADADRPFDVERGPLLRASLYSRAPDDHVLLLSVHHTITDFWSLSVLVDQLVAAYHDPAAGVATTSAAGRVPAAQTAFDRATLDHASLAYWREQLDGAPPALELPTAFPRPRVQSFRGDSHQFRLGAGTLRAVDAFAAGAGLTRFAVLAAALTAVLARYAGTDDLVLGAPTSPRRGGDHDRLGYLVNPVPLRLRVPATATFRELARQVRARVLAALDHQVPFPLLVEQLRPARDPGRSPLVQVMMAFQQPPAGRPDLSAFAVADESAQLRLGELDVSPYQLVERGAAFDLAVTMAEVDGGLTGLLSFAADLFDRAAMARLAGHLTTLLDRALSSPDRPVAELDLLDSDERDRLLALGTGPTVPFPDQTSLPALFAERAAGWPQAVAVVSGREQLTYEQLHERAAAVAAQLANKHGVRPGDLVGVHLPRGLTAVVAFWAALASGGVYLPLPSDLPRQRLAWLLADARPAVVLTDRDGAAQLPADGPPPLCLDQPMSGPPEFSSRCGPDDLAYALYTSGSTGAPKAVLLDQRGACNLAAVEIDGLGVTPASQLLQFAAASYDVHVSEILCAHLTGATLHIPPPAATVPGQPLLDLLAGSRITHAWMSPSVLAALPNADLPHLSTILCGGEACSPEVVARWAPGRRFLNGYGPAETTVCATWARCDEADPRRPPIGRPLPNVRVYLLDSRGQPVPVGVPGEIYIGGAGVGRGYLGRDDLTAQRFSPDPFAASPGARMYRTGDLARWRPDGAIDFLGRVDDQVQVRGVRVEPGEVAAHLRRLVPDDQQVAVVARDAPGGAIELVAYLAADASNRLPVAELRTRLRAELPEPLLPAAFVYLDRLPLNASGKLDRRALPAPTPADRGVAGRISPRTELERTVAEVWAQALQQPVVGVRDHFFDELGGSSLLVARVVGELGRRLGREVPVTWMFEHPTVEGLSRRLAEADRRPGEPGGPGDPGSPAPDQLAARRRQALGQRRRSARHD